MRSGGPHAGWARRVRRLFALALVSGSVTSLISGSLLPAFVEAQAEPVAAQAEHATAQAEPATAQAEPAGFIPGEATAQAGSLVLGLSPGGGKPIDVGLGRATARYQNRTATAEGTALSLGLLQIFFGPSSACGDRPPIIPADQLPPVTTNDSRRNQPMATPVEVRSPGDPGTATVAGTPGGIIGTQIANAGATPQESTAATTTVTQDFGVLALDNGATSVTTRLDGGVRTATAVSTASRLRILGDMVVIDQPRWEATTTSGTTESATATFTFARATILGIDRTPATFTGDFNDFAVGVSQFLGGLGVTLRAPTVVAEPGRITMTPFVVGLANPPIGLDLIKPLLTALAPLKEENTRNLIAEDCNNQAILQVADLVLGVLSGSGAVTLSAGGVTAFTAATEFPEPPPLEIPDLSAPPVAPEVVPIAPVVADLSATRPLTGNVPDFGADLGLPVTEPVTAALPAVAEPTPTSPPTTEATFQLPTATLVSRRFEPGTTGGSAALVGAAGLVGLLLLAGADRFVMRRTKREMPD